MITPAQRAEIRRLFYGEHWKVGTIAQLGLHRETVRAAVERETAGVRPSCVGRASSTRICRSSTPWRSTRGRPLTEMGRQRAMPGSVRRLGGAGPSPAAPSTAGS